jgi:hypothetical protein
MNEIELIQTINRELAIQLPEKLSPEALRDLLKEEINRLIQNDFQKLVSVLYRVDVNERKLKYLLQENVGEDAAVIIADLIIERQLQKIKSRREFSQRDDAVSDEEKW